MNETHRNHKPNEWGLRGTFNDVTGAGWRYYTTAARSLVATGPEGDLIQSSTLDALFRFADRVAAGASGLSIPEDPSSPFLV